MATCRSSFWFTFVWIAGFGSLVELFTGNCLGAGLDALMSAIARQVRRTRNSAHRCPHLEILG
jgi:hypothetical protein